MNAPLRILAHDSRVAELRLFGAGQARDVPVTRACIASMAIPPFFSPVQIGERYCSEPGPARSCTPRSRRRGAEVSSSSTRWCRCASPRAASASARDRGTLTIVNQAIRIGTTRALREHAAREESGKAVLTIEPETGESLLFSATRELRGAPPHPRVRVPHTRAPRDAGRGARHPALERAGLVARPVAASRRARAGVRA
jgi:predicted acylesterase/phospholipase RssA